MYGIVHTRQALKDKNKLHNTHLYHKAKQLIGVRACLVSPLLITILKIEQRKAIKWGDLELVAIVDVGC